MTAEPRPIDDLFEQVKLVEPCPTQVFMAMTGHRARRRPPTKAQKAAQQWLKDHPNEIADLQTLVDALPRWTQPPPNRYPERRMRFPRRRLFKPPKNEEYWVKPARDTGFWTSTYLDDERISDWVRWCRDETFPYPGEYRSYLLDVDPEAVVIQIDGPKDLFLLDQLGLLLRDDALHSSMARIDFEMLAEGGVAGVNLTEQGQWATRLHLEYSLYGWDSESTVWLDWAFTNVREGPKVVINRQEDE